MTDQTTQGKLTVHDEEPPEGTADLFPIDYAAIAAATEPDQPGGRIVYDSGDYATDEEADEALDAFFDDIMDRAIDRLVEAIHEKA